MRLGDLKPEALGPLWSPMVSGCKQVGTVVR